MNGNLQMIWNEVSNTFIKEQRPYIMSYSIFMSYFIHKKNKQILPMDFFKEKALINLADPEDYEVKEAFFILEKAMDRAYMLEFPVARKLSEELPQKLEQLKISTIEDVNQCIDELQYLLTYENGFSFMPESLLKLITQFALLEKAESVANFCCGFSYTGLSVWNALKKNWGTEPRFQAVDYNRFYCAISRILAWINEVPECQIKNRDILEPEIGNISKADLIIADIPKGMNDIYCLFGCEKRFLGYKKKSVYTDWVFIVDVLEHLKENGRAFVIVTKGALVRRNEKALRKMYVECDWLEAVITLPPNMYANTNMAMELVIFRRKAKKTHQTFFADLNEFAEKTASGRNRITEVGMDLLIKSYRKEGKAAQSQIGKWVSEEEICNADYSLNSMTYLELEKIQSDMRKSVALGEVAQVIRGVQISKEDEQALREKPTHYLLNVKDIEKGRIYYNETGKIRGKNVSWDEKYQIREDDIIITSKGSLIKVAIVPPNPPKAYIMGNLTIIRGTEKKYHPYILYEFLLSKKGEKSMEGIQTGSTIKVLNVSQLQKMQIPLYEIEESWAYGEELKKNEIHYRQQMEYLKRDYENTKAVFLKRLK